MMGPRQEAQGALFYAFSVDDHVPKDHLLRAIDRFVDLADLRKHLAPFYSSTGRPSVDPELMIRMLIVGYTMGIRSERHLCEEVHLNLAYRWFCRLDLAAPIPDHSTFSKNRHGRFSHAWMGFVGYTFDTLAHCRDDNGLYFAAGFAGQASAWPAISACAWAGKPPALKPHPPYSNAFPSRPADSIPDTLGSWHRRCWCTS